MDNPKDDFTGRYGLYTTKPATNAYVPVTGITFCGENGIRTREPLLTVTRFPGVPLQPLEHLSLHFRVQMY